MSPADLVRRSGGIVRTSVLRDHGVSDRRIADAVATRTLIRPRRGWLAAPDADVDLVGAARAGVVLTCATQAVRLGLWVLRPPGRPHVAAGSNAGRVRVATNTSTGLPSAIVHWATPLIPREPFALVDPVENVLARVAHCLPFEEALAVWDSALNKSLIDLAALRRLPLSERMRRLADASDPFRDSGIETFVPHRLRWLGVRIVAQAWIAGHRVDFLIGERLVLQVDGGSHVGPQRDADNAHDATLLLLGYRVIRVGYAQVVHDWPAVQHAVMRAVAQGLHRAA